MFITDLDIEKATNQEKCKIMISIITRNATYIPCINIKHFAKLEGCKEDDIKRFIYGL